MVALFDSLQSTLQKQGPAPAIDQLCRELRQQQDYNHLFYALLMKKRHELGVLPIPTGPAQDLPSDLHSAYEDGIRNAAREVGQLFLDAGNIPQAWVYFRMIEEPEKIKEALKSLVPGEDEDIQPLIQISFYEGVDPVRGFDWILSRYGICSAITTIGGGELPFSAEVKNHCIRALVRALYEELRERLANEIEHRFNIRPPAADKPAGTKGVVRELIKDRDWLFADDAYHIDTSHLSSVVQMATTLPRCDELDLACELCEYGAKLTGRFLAQEEPPFEEGYNDYRIYIRILSGEAVEEGIKHFREKLETYNPEEIGTYPAEVLVNLLLRIDHGREALEVAQKYLSDAETQGRQLTCPNLNELCQRLKAYGALADMARKHGDVVHYLAGLIAEQTQ